MAPARKMVLKGLPTFALRGALAFDPASSISRPRFTAAGLDLTNLQQRASVSDLPSPLTHHQPPQIGSIRMAKRNKKTAPKSFRTVVRDTVTGRFAPKAAAKRRPKTTVTSRIRLGRTGAKQKKK
jgi:hypothetical protein